MTLIELKNKFMEQYFISSEYTKVKYEKDIALFFEVSELKTVEDLNNLNISHINKFYDFAKKKEWNTNTLNQRLLTMKIFCNWCKENNYIDNNYLKQIKLAKTKNEIHFTPPMQDCLKLLNYIDKHTKQKRLYLMTKLLVNSALRRSEICNLKLTDIDETENCIKVIGKGKKIVNQPVPHKLIVELIDYVNGQRKEIMKKYTAIGGKDKGYLFVSGIGDDCNESKKDLCNGNRVRETSFYNQIKRYAKLAGVENADKFTLHCIRRSSGTDIYNITKDVKVASEFLRHSNIATTVRHYIDFDREKITQAVNDRFNEI